MWTGQLEGVSRWRAGALPALLVMLDWLYGPGGMPLDWLLAVVVIAAVIGDAVLVILQLPESPSDQEHIEA